LQNRVSADLSAGLSETESRIPYHRRGLNAFANNTADPGASDTQALAAFGVFDGVPMSEANFQTDKASVESPLATLVADGASPTQAHVTTLNSAWTTYKKDLIARHYTASTRTTFEADLGTLVADGASPTQTHVTIANTDYGTFKATVI